jgi:5'(3')-deoxyribonucleotidase
MRIIIDMDETIVDLVGPWMDDLNKKVGRAHTRDEIHCYSVESTYPELEPVLLFECFNTPGFWSGLQPFPGAIDFVSALYEDGHQIYIASIPCEAPLCAWEKIQWIKDWLPFLDEECWFLTRSKYMIRGDVIIDDNPKLIWNFRGSLHHHNGRLLFNRPWNTDEVLIKEGYRPDTFTRVMDYQEATKRIDEMNPYKRLV